jgi:hypothetical protein
VVNPRFDIGTLYGLNAYDVDKRMAGHLPAGTVKRVRLIEGVPQNTPVAGAPLVPRRLIGEAPVEADGSFNIEVPADTPMTLQTLDERGLALATCDWIWVKPKETRGCIGCHEDPERIPENEYVLALRRPSNSLMLKPEQRRGIGFVEDVAPLLKTHCATADCHGGRKSDLRLPVSKNNREDADFAKWYDTLVRPKGKSASGKYVDPGRARASWLVWQLMGTNTSRAWDMNSLPAAAKPAKVNQMPPADHPRQLSPEELRTIVQWIDLGAHFRSFTTHTPSPASQPQ